MIQPSPTRLTFHRGRYTIALVAAIGALTTASVGLGSAAVNATVDYPEGYRAWFHVKTVLVTPAHPNFEQSGGFRHIYANPAALTGYRSGSFADGSIIVVDWIAGKAENGAFDESARRRLDVMVKDSARFAKTGGWGFERFDGSSRTARTVTSPAAQCFECHTRSGTRDSVFSKVRD